MTIKYMMFTVVVCASMQGCVSQIEKPYIKETIQNKDGTTTVRETSAERVTGASLDGLGKARK